MKYLILALALLVSGCNETVSVPNKTDVSNKTDTVILYRDGEAKRSEVTKFGVYCAVAWYKSIENLLLRRNGTITNRPFQYQWSLKEFGNEEDLIWFDKNCKEPPSP